MPPITLSSLGEAIRSKDLKWKPRETPLSRLPAQEARKRLLPRAPAAEGEALKKFFFAPTRIPDLFDWRSVDGRSCVTPPKDQDGNPVCIAYAVTAAVESNLLLTLEPFISSSTGDNGSIDLSEHALYSLNKRYPACREFLMETGLPPEADYTATDAAARAGWQLSTVRVTECQHYERLTMDEVKALIVFGGPIVAGLNVPDDFFSYSSGVYASTTNSIAGFHLVLVIGYDDKERCFICKNSWGTGWGENGYFRISYSEFQGGNTGFGTLIDTFTGVRMTSPVRTPIALRTASGNYVTMVNGGGLGGPNSGPGAVALHTDATKVGPWEVFRLEWIDGEHFAIRTHNDNYVTAVNAGGVGGPNDGRSPVHTDAVANGPWERLYLSYNPRTNQAILQTADGHYLTAVNGGGVGGPNTTPIHTDATALGPWEAFSIEVARS